MTIIALNLSFLPFYAIIYLTVSCKVYILSYYVMKDNVLLEQKDQFAL